jgi:hypothetical protein
VGISPRVEIGLEPDPAQQRSGPRPSLPRAEPVDARAEGDRLLNRQSRIERSIAVLKHHLHVAAQVPQRDPFARRDRLAIEDHFAVIRFDQPHQQSRCRRFAAAAFADHTQGLTLRNRE